MILDYGGTLQPHVPQVSEAAPDEQLRDVLERLASLASVYVISQRSAEVLDGWLGDIPLGLVCENGAAVKHPGGVWPEEPEIDYAILETLAKPMMADFVEHTPGSRLEQRRASLTWHYRMADPRLGALRAKELYAQLEDLVKGLPWAVLRSARSIEVRPVSLTKMYVVERLLELYPAADFVFCAGNDRVDEGMFEVALRSERPTVLTCYVGGKDTVGQYFVESPAELVDQLDALAALWQRPPTVVSETHRTGCAPINS